MRFLWIFALVICAIVAIEGFPGSKLQNALKAKKECQRQCTADYSPVCAAEIEKQNSTSKLFGNKCVLSLHNCEHDSHLVEVDMNKCKNSQGIRLF